tara:strand:+ start:140 stop:1582 length:1443 start_codon:yes stop_codon:yes gene_type:complete
MAQMALKEETMPDGGIADFIISDAELDAMNVADAKREFGGYGIANFDKIASKMASYGRYGDDKLVHAETGELIVPKALIEGNPELKNSIFGHLREMGIEDPERYVVGSEANSLNPDTGLPEFFLKNVFKGVSKAFKNVGKALKKAAPVVLPVALSFTPLGAVYGAALGSGLGTLLQGGDIEDALKSAVIAGGTGALFKGATGTGSFGENISAELANPGARFSQLGQGITGSENFFRPFDAPTLAPLSGSAEAVQTTMNPLDSPQDFAMTPQTGPSVQTGSATTDPSFFDQAKEFIMPSNVSTTDALKQMGIDPATATETQFNLAKEMAAEQSPGFFRRFGPSIALAGLGIGAAGGFEAEEEDEPEFLTGVELLEQNREKYGLPEEQIQYVADYNPFVPQRPVFPAAEGGGVPEVFPRRTGGIMPDEGIPNEDSVRAMLMPGEFVMTTDAVKGLGNGDNEQGIRNMYQMMRGLEAKGRAMA